MTVGTGHWALGKLNAMLSTTGYQPSALNPQPLTRAYFPIQRIGSV